jgi:hypothetical protein
MLQYDDGRTPRETGRDAGIGCFTTTSPRRRDSAVDTTKKLSPHQEAASISQPASQPVRKTPAQPAAEPASPPASQLL